MMNEPQVQIAPAQPPTHTTVIVRQGQPVPNNYLAYAILVTLFCCLPFGIVAIVKSQDVRSRYDSGDYEGAEQASKDTKKWAKIGLITGIVFNLIWIVAIIVYYVVVISAVTSVVSSFSFDPWDYHDYGSTMSS